MTTDARRHERIPVTILPTPDALARAIAQRIAELIRTRDPRDERTVLGLATGSTPVGVYAELVRMHREEGLSFRNVVTFNLDEYWPMPADSIHSYRRFMEEHLFSLVDIDPSNCHLPPGDVPREDVAARCAEYEELIRDMGGIDLQLLGIGKTGHIGFNEPGSGADSRTRLITLDAITRRDAATDFFGEGNVPRQAITMGVATILDAREVLLLATGEHKAAIVQRAVEGEVDHQVAATFLQRHPAARIYCDDAAAAALTRVATPWLVDEVVWDDALALRAVAWLSLTARKAILKLTEGDYVEHHLSSLLAEHGEAGAVNGWAFNVLGAKIRGRSKLPKGKTVICFSPHPDDDVISAGGILRKLVLNENRIVVAYMTSGNIAVFDHDALRHIDYVTEFLELFGLQSDDSRAIETQLRQAITLRPPGEVDAPDVLKVKALIRQTEALQAARTAGIPAERCHFLNLPFYRTGQVRKNPIGPEDVAIIARLLTDLNPGQIYVAGDLSDPHGTHRMCAQAILAALDDVAEDGVRPETWLYRGAWQEYEPHEIDRAVPLSPELLLKKKLAIFKHESQKDAALFPGHDEREFWVRADERTKETARRYNALGLPEYYAIESFKRYDGAL